MLVRGIRTFRGSKGYQEQADTQDPSGMHGVVLIALRSLKARAFSKGISSWGWSAWGGTDVPGALAEGSRDKIWPGQPGSPRYS
jgi:hypothetical protein